MDSDKKPIILIATIGSSPAVLTETLYELHRQGEWPVAEVEILTTNHGAKQLNNSLFIYLADKKGGFYQLCEELGIPPHSISIKTGDDLKPVSNENDEPIEDIRDRRDDEYMAAAIQQSVREQCSRTGRRVIGLLAGGRKTMSARLMSAMQLFARPEDRLIHVLVSEPFESIPEFFFPTHQKKMMTRKTVTGETEGIYDASTAGIDLIDIPFIKLRTYLETQLDFSKPFTELLAEVDEHLLSASHYPVQSLIIDLFDSCIYVNGLNHRIPVEARPLSIFTLFVVLNQLNGKPRDVTWGEIVHDFPYLYLLHVIYRKIKRGPMEGVDESYRQMNYKEFEAEDKWSKVDYWQDENGRLHKRDFAVKRNQLLRQIREGLNQYNIPVQAEHLFYFRENRSMAFKATHRVSVPVGHIDLRGITGAEIRDALEE